MSQRKINILDKIGSLIPGYNGYVIRDEKRNTDKKIRESIALSIQQSESLIVQHQSKLLSMSGISQIKKWETVRKSLNTLHLKIKNTSYGESSFFSENQLKEEELDMIYSFDLEISEKTSLISKSIQEEMDEILTIVFVIKQIRDIETLLIERLSFINQYK